MSHARSWLALWLLTPLAPALAQSAGSFVQGGNTQVSAMMMFLGNTQKVYMLDKSEGNAAQINGHPAMGSVYDIASNTAEVMDVTTNTFCASGMHLPNGSFVTFGGNGAIGPGGNAGSVPGTDGASSFDATYQDYDGRKSIRILNPCPSGSDFVNDPNCVWFDNPAVLSMQEERWYSAAEPLGDGSIAIIGGFVNGGYVNRNWPSPPGNDPGTQGGGATPTYEFYPSKGAAQVMQFIIDTSGLNSYALTYLMPSGNLFLQANLSTMLWDPIANVENRLQDMPNGVVRVYPASGANAMLPLTPANNYTPTVIFCGGSNMPPDDYGNYSWPWIDTFNYPASNDCQRITPEPADGSQPAYVQDDDMPEGRTMGQFIALPDGTLFLVNGGANGTAGYSDRTLTTPDISQMPFGMSLAAGPIGTPAIYNPNAPAGSRWSSAGLSSSNIPRLYHSSAILLPDASVLIAGSNPNVDVNTSTIYPTTYETEIFYPPYFSASTRPAPTGIPQNLSYGGAPFDITVPSSSYSGSANDAADNTTVMLMRPGFTTHAMNMGQRALQLNNTYTVNQDGSIVLHVSQAPPNPNVLQPGPVMLFVVVNGIPSNGTMLIVGNGQIGTQPTAAAQPLPASVRLDTSSGSANSTSTPSSGSSNSSDDASDTSSTSHTGAIVGGIVGAIAVIGILGALAGICITRRRRTAQMLRAQNGGGGTAGGFGMQPMRDSDPAAFAPLQLGNDSMAWGASSASLNPPTPYKDYTRGPTPSSAEYEPYYEQHVQHGATQPAGPRY